jgi:protein tyrosine/serine phosphatase
VTQRLPGRRARWGRALSRTLAPFALALALWPLGLQLSGNFHAVDPGIVYRAAQPEPEDLRRWAKVYGLRSVLNLRGASPHADWYRAEKATTEDLGLVLANFSLSASHNPGPARVAELVALLRDLPKPVLIHCQSGADRTGLAAALYLGAVAGRDAATAEGQLSYAFGHVGLPMVSAAWAMDQTWEAAEPALGHLDRTRAPDLPKSDTFR